MEDEQYN